MMCKYKNIFGKPNEGLHSYRLFDIAIVDVVLTVILGVIIAKISKINTFTVLFGLFLLSIMMHRLFCVDTKITRILFGNINQ